MTQREAVTAWIGMVVFLASWALLFAALFFAYGILRARAPEWPPAGVVHVPRDVAGLGALVVVLSSVALWRGRVVLATFLGAGFLGAQAFLWSRAWEAGILPSSGPYGSVFWAFSTVHAAHALVGVVALVVCAARRRVGLWAHYWHFVGIVWMLMYLVVVLP